MVWKVYSNHEDTWIQTVQWRSDFFPPTLNFRGSHNSNSYEDNIITTGNDSGAAARLEDHLAKHFGIKKLGPLKYFLGMEVAQSSNGLIITQQNYILDLLEEIKLVDGHINDTPIKASHKLTISEDDPRIKVGSY